MHSCPPTARLCTMFHFASHTVVIAEISSNTILMRSYIFRTYALSKYLYESVMKAEEKSAHFPKFTPKSNAGSVVGHSQAHLTSRTHMEALQQQQVLLQQHGLSANTSSAAMMGPNSARKRPRSPATARLGELSDDPDKELGNLQSSKRYMSEVCVLLLMYVVP